MAMSATNSPHVPVSKTCTFAASLPRRYNCTINPGGYMKRPAIVTTVLTASLAISSAAVLWHPATAVAAKDDTRKERMEKDKWTNADRARDALDHLKKAQAQLENITNNNKDA